MQGMFIAMMLGSSPAQAVGVGSSVGVGTTGPGLFLPSLDFHFDPILLQIHVMEFFNQIDDNDQLYLGANLYVDAHQADLKGPWSGVVQPGGGLDLYIDPTIMVLTGECRLGAQTATEAGGLGVYVVPSLGIAFGDNIDGDLLAGGALQISAWFGN
ncbi:MAG TPA: hypothetical protein ENK18_20300 [Deltaproteobacteria bacterium]|nr:hypothetical protein [Deltaproteobacteria bacterium]